MMQAQIENFKEDIPDNEHTIIKEIIELSLHIQRKEPPVPSNQYLKNHGCVRAKFIVERDVT